MATRPSRLASAAPRSPDSRWWEKNDPCSSADSRASSLGAAEVRMASPVPGGPPVSSSKVGPGLPPFAASSEPL
jgi:hypothetical protein